MIQNICSRYQIVEKQLLSLIYIQISNDFFPKFINNNIHCKTTTIMKGCFTYWTVCKNMEEGSKTIITVAIQGPSKKMQQGTDQSTIINFKWGNIRSHHNILQLVQSKQGVCIIALTLQYQMLLLYYT